MDTTLSTGTSLRCGHSHKSNPWGHDLTDWEVFTGDRRVSRLPQDSVAVHNCEKLAVSQEKRGVKRFYQVFDESIIIKS